MTELIEELLFTSKIIDLHSVLILSHFLYLLILFNITLHLLLFEEEIIIILPDWTCIVGYEFCLYIIFLIIMM